MSDQNLITFEFRRPLLKTDELGSFLTVAHDVGNAVFGKYHYEVIDQPVGVETTEEGVALMSEAHDLGIPKLEVYGNGDLRLPLIEDQAVQSSRVNHVTKFNNIQRRITNNPQIVVARTQPRPEDPNSSVAGHKPTALDLLMEDIGEAFGIEDQSIVDIKCTDVQLAVPSHMDGGPHEVALIPDSSSVIGQMLVKQAMCLREAQYRKNKQMFAIQSPATLRIPFARLPADAEPGQIVHFISRMRTGLLKRQRKFTLGKVTAHLTSSTKD